MPTPNADGPDTSHYQTYTGGPLPWPLHSLKCSEGKKSGDLTFPARWQMLRTLGVKYRGAYHWIRSDSSIADQAANLCARIDLTGGLSRGEFIQCDWEVTPNIPTNTSIQVAEWCDRVEQHFGRACTIVYSSDWLPDSTLDADKVAEFTEWRQENPDFPLWYANYNLTDRSYGGWAECAQHRADVWQWTSSYLHPSIVGRFDMNHVFNWSTLDRITDQVPAPKPASEDEMARYVIQDKLLGGACYWADTLAPVGDELVARIATDPNIVIVEQDHEPTTAAFNERNGAAVAVALEKFRDSRDGVAD